MNVTSRFSKVCITSHTDEILQTTFQMGSANTEAIAAFCAGVGKPNCGATLEWHGRRARQMARRLHFRLPYARPLAAPRPKRCASRLRCPRRPTHRRLAGDGKGGGDDGDGDADGRGDSAPQLRSEERHSQAVHRG